MSDKQRECSVFRREVGARLRQRRLMLNLSQEEVAWEANVAQGSISNYEIGRNDIPLTVLLRVCRALSMSPAELIPAFDGVPEQHFESLRDIA